MMDFSFPGAFPQQQINLTFREQAFKDPGYVLVYAFYESQLLFTHHRQRGWELPGGVRKINESPDMAAMREVYEETGAEITDLKRIGQYSIIHPSEQPLIKSIYTAQIKQIRPIPIGFETDAIQLFNEPPAPDRIIYDPRFSPLLKDDVYRFSLPIALSTLVMLQKQS